eukprot:6182104-Pleurochrysis_carterae.AAC.1
MTWTKEQSRALRKQSLENVHNKAWTTIRAGGADGIERKGKEDGIENDEVATRERRMTLCLLYSEK